MSEERLEAEGSVERSNVSMDEIFCRVMINGKNVPITFSGREFREKVMKHFEAEKVGDLQGVRVKINFHW